MDRIKSVSFQNSTRKMLKKLIFFRFLFAEILEVEVVEVHEGVLEPSDPPAA